MEQKVREEKGHTFQQQHSQEPALDQTNRCCRQCGSGRKSGPSLSVVDSTHFQYRHTGGQVSTIHAWGLKHIQIARELFLSRCAFEALQVKWSSLQICDFALCLSSSRRQCVNNVLCLNPQARIHIVIICTMFPSLCLLHNNIMC